MNRFIKSAVAIATTAAFVVGNATLLRASPPGMGGYGGGWNWGSAAIGALGTIDAIRRSNSGNNPNYGDNIRRSPQRTYNTPNNNTYVRPNTVTPHTNVVPRTNVIPKNVVPQTVVTPVVNAGTARVMTLTEADIARMKNELKDQNVKVLDGLMQQLAAAVNDLIAKLPGAAMLTTAQRQELVDAVNRGDAAAVGRLLGNGADSAAGRNLVGLATARGMIDAVRSGINNGSLAGAELIALINAFNGAAPRNVILSIGQLAVNQQVIIWLGAAQPGVNLIPAGSNVPIALIPGLQQGLIIPLGFGPTLIGIGRMSDVILIGEGNVLQAAGLPAAIGPPVPDFDGPIGAGQVILTNVGQDPVNYAVNGSQFGMQPTFKQDLPGGQAWTVQFDRGGPNGNAEYQLSEGYYEFTPTPKGWELYKKSFEIDLENGNDFDFHYVLDNQHRTLAAGRTDGLVGAFPPVIRFDNAEGAFKQKRLTEGKYRIAVTANTALDVFPAASVPEPPKPEQFIVGAGLPNSTSSVPSSATGISAPVASSPAAAKPDSAAVAITLPPGFHPLDPVDLLTASADQKVAKAKLPPAFTMFATNAGGDGAN